MFVYPLVKCYVWQSHVKIHHYSVVYLTTLPHSKHFSAELPLKVGSYALHKFIRHSCTYAAHISPTLKEVLHHSISNAVMWLKYATE